MSDRDVLRESVRFLSKVLRGVDMERLGEIVREGIERDKIEEIEKVKVGVCPECGGFLLIKRAKKRFLGCSNYPNCKFSLPLPQRGTLKITSKVCERHGVKVLRVVEKDKKRREFCPLCSQHSRNV